MPKRFRPLGSFNCADALALGSGAARVVQTIFIHWDFAGKRDNSGALEMSFKVWGNCHT